MERTAWPSQPPQLAQGPSGAEQGAGSPERSGHLDSIKGDLRADPAALCSKSTLAEVSLGRRTA
jgi:hypothetical protein